VKKSLTLIFLLCIAGCSKQEVRPEALANRLKDADRVVVTNIFSQTSITLTGAEVSKVVQAIAAGKKAIGPPSCGPDFRFEFFKTAEHLGTVPICLNGFWIGDTTYDDPTGTLTALGERFREMDRSRSLP